jgi:hypothetical protein
MGRAVSSRDLALNVKRLQMATEQRCSVRLLVFGASMREGSLNERLASLAATVVQEKGGEVERAKMSDFECTPYDTDVELSAGIPHGAKAMHDKLIATDGFIIALPRHVALAQAHRAFDSAGRIADSKLQNWFETTIECFIDLVEASKHYPHLKKQWVEFLGERPDEETTRVELGETAAV